MKTKPEFKQGYKGPGMCSNCAYSDKRTGLFHTSETKKTFLHCDYYDKDCARVSWNCTGIRIVRYRSSDK